MRPPDFLRTDSSRTIRKVLVGGAFTLADGVPRHFLTRFNDDGTVEVLASGDDGQLQSLRDKLKQGPRASRVDSVDEHPAEAPNELKNFSIHGAW